MGGGSRLADPWFCSPRCSRALGAPSQLGGHPGLRAAWGQPGCHLTASKDSLKADKAHLL